MLWSTCCNQALTAANAALADGAWRGGGGGDSVGASALAADVAEAGTAGGVQEVATEASLLTDADEAATAATVRTMAAEAHRFIAPLSSAQLLGLSDSALLQSR